MTATRLAPRTWSAFVVLGLAGQLAWTVENMYLNVFVFDTITDSPQVIAALVAASAVVATLTTIVVGAWSDRTGRRRVLVATGYVLWGLATAAFGLVGPESMGALVPGWEAVTAAIVGIIVLDCIMSFFGAAANDAGFQSWVTDSTDASNRGRVDGVLGTMPLIAMLLVFGALDPLTKSGDWGLFFGVVGGATAVVGLLALIAVRDRAPAVRSGGPFADVIFGLRPSTVRGNPRLYQMLLVLALAGTASQVFFPFLIIYIQRSLRIDAYALVLGVVLIVASLVSILGGRVIDRVGKLRSILPAFAIFGAGLIGMVFVRDLLPVIIAATVMMSGFLLSFAAIIAMIRDLSPADRAGTVQGLRMIAAVLVPMVIGPWIGAAVISGVGETYVDLGVEKQVPSSAIFLAAAVVLALAVPAVAVLLRRVRGAAAVAEASAEERPVEEPLGAEERP